MKYNRRNGGEKKKYNTIFSCFVYQDDRVITMIEHCVYDRTVVTLGHTHRSSYAMLVNNGNTRVRVIRKVYLWIGSSQSIYTLCRQFLTTRSFSFNDVFDDLFIYLTVPSSTMNFAYNCIIMLTCFWLPVSVETILSCTYVTCTFMNEQRFSKCLNYGYLFQRYWIIFRLSTNVNFDPSGSYCSISHVLFAFETNINIHNINKFLI